MNNLELEGEDEEFGSIFYETEQRDSEFDSKELNFEESIGHSEEEDAPENNNEDEEEEDEVDDCCGCPPKQNKFLISFQNTSRLGDVWLDESRIKCKAFWSFIDANPGLQKLIKEGSPVIPPAPDPLFDGCDGVCTKSGKGDFLKACRSPSEEARSARALPLVVKSRVNEERRRFHARQAAIVALQLKSGQPIFTAKHEPLPNYRNVYADEIQEIQLIPALCGEQNGLPIQTKEEQLK